MTRQEFGALLTMAKNNANVKLTDSLPYIRSLSERKMKSIENGSYNYNLSDAFLYINMCGKTFGVLWDFIDSIKGLREAMNRHMKDDDTSESELSKQSGVSVSVINAFLTGHASLKIDTFLKLMDGLREDITIE